MFHLYAQTDIFSKSWFILSAHTLMLLTTEKIEIPSAKSLMYIKKNKDPKIELCGQPASTGVHAEY